ncbi:MAG TPA: hypothetical protein VF645_11050 [Allosphingosinicella sp.]|jgi:hypothetical protein
MKIILFAAALTLGSAALAQTGNTVSDPSQSMGPRGVSQQGTDPDGMACSPAGYNANTTGYQACAAGNSNAAAGTGAAAPRCSKTVKDGCIQAYERGVRR